MKGALRTSALGDTRAMGASTAAAGPPWVPCLEEGLKIPERPPHVHSFRRVTL